MTLAWFIWYGLRIGLTLNETYDMRIGELQDLIAIEQIKCEDFTQGRKLKSEQEEFFELLKWK